MSNTIKVCEYSLKWIQAIRKNAHIHHYDLNLISCPKRYPEIFGDHTGDFGHSGGSFYWSVKQAKKIDNMGLENWSKTENALGYSHCFKKAFDSFMYGKVSPQELQ